MCGIAGIVRFERAARVEPLLVEAMTDALWHRGPDDSGAYVEGNVGLGSRRLSIIDRSGGRQPLYDEDGSVALVCNGEIYNHRELRAALEGRGHVFRTHSDCETLVHAYQDDGERFVARLRGMFGFALWDRRRRRLVLGRDRLGIKPLYYHVGRDFLAFASEIKALQEVPGVPSEVDPEALDLYLSLRFVPGPRTLFRGIQKLQPGHLLVWDETCVRLPRYWDLAPAEATAGSDHELVRRFGEALESSVDSHLMSEVPLGLFLSGGLDSTTMLAVMSRLAQGRRVSTFAVGYQTSSREGNEANELDFARLAAERFGADHHEIRLEASDWKDALPRLVWHLDEPVADPACLPLYFLSREAREHVTVILSGEGADEILGGYGIYGRMLSLERLRSKLGAGASRLLAPLAAALLPGDKLPHYARLGGLPLEARYRGVSRAFHADWKARLLGRDAAAVSDGPLDEVFDPYFAAFAASSSPLDRMLYADVKVWLPDDLLVKADKMTMAHSQELRVPFLDHELVELALALPQHLKRRGATGKIALRRAMQGVVPAPILKRGKKGFTTPTSSWLRHELRGFTRELLLASDSACRSWFDIDAVEQLVEQHERGVAVRDDELWSLLVFETWHGVFVERRFRPERRSEVRRRAGTAVAAG
ncbi:MAG TPA: asparagine synthase (glutamine-hydrolyzing) [Thermoanaerobaculia bacterium]|nr:asparagine synthase (glutamine-hydrolyzing) [Thermoanaerobaculia bacterium]